MVGCKYCKYSDQVYSDFQHIAGHAHFGCESYRDFEISKSGGSAREIATVAQKLAEHLENHGRSVNPHSNT